MLCKMRAIGVSKQHKKLDPELKEWDGKASSEEHSGPEKIPGLFLHASDWTPFTRLKDCLPTRAFLSSSARLPHAWRTVTKILASGLQLTPPHNISNAIFLYIADARYEFGKST